VRLVLPGHDKKTWIAGTNIEAAAEQGDPKAQLMLGWHYYIGHGVAQDKSVAAKWYEKAARVGLPEAERLFELVSTECNRPSIAGLVIGGQPTRSKWKLASRVLILMVTLAAVVSISYYYWPRNQQQVTIESDHSDSTKEPKPRAKVTEQETIVDSNSSGRDPNYIPIQKSKSKIEKLAELADKWLEESPNEKD